MTKPETTTLYIPLTLPTVDLEALHAAQTGHDDDIVLAAEKAMRARLAPTMRHSSADLELGDILAYQPATEPAPGTTTLTLPAEPEFASAAVLDAVTERYFARRAETDNDDPTSPVARGVAAAKARVNTGGWLRQELEREVESLERAWRRIAEHAAESLAELHTGKLGSMGTGMSQVDQAYRAVERFPTAITTALDVATYQAIMVERDRDAEAAS